MYHATIHFFLLNLPKNISEQLAALPPLERFAHEFHNIKNLAELTSEKDHILLYSDKNFSAEDLRAAVGEGMLICCAENPSRLSPAMLSILDEVWTLPLTDDLLAFYFQKLQQKLKAAKDAWLTSNYLESTINTLPDLIWFKDKIGAHLKVNDAFCEIVGKEKSDIEGRGHYYIWGLTPEEYAQGEFVCLETEEEVFRRRETCLFDEEVSAPEGMRELKTYKTPIFDESGMDMIGTVGIARDVTLEHQYRDRILHLANHDALTGLANRRYFQHYLEETSKETDFFTFVYLDLDHFKEANDTYGHEKGDDALVLMATALKNDFPDAFPVRLGGDEFLLIFTGEQDFQKLEDRISFFIDEMERLFLEHLSLDLLSVSAGLATGTVASVRRPGGIDALLHESDRALYNAKRSGRAQLCTAPSCLL